MHKLIFICVLCATGIFSVNAYADQVDPTQPTEPGSDLYGNSANGGLHLNAVLYYTINPVVIINGNVLHLNDNIGLYKLTEIHKQSVQLTSQKGEVINLKLYALDVKKPHI